MRAGGNTNLLNKINQFHRNKKGITKISGQRSNGGRDYSGQNNNAKHFDHLTYMYKLDFLFLTSGFGKIVLEF